jgi:hypothetical protein
MRASGLAFSASKAVREFAYGTGQTRVNVNFVARRPRPRGTPRSHSSAERSRISLHLGGVVRAAEPTIYFVARRRKGLPFRTPTDYPSPAGLFCGSSALGCSQLSRRSPAPLLRSFIRADAGVGRPKAVNIKCSAIDPNPETVRVAPCYGGRDRGALSQAWSDFRRSCWICGNGRSSARRVQFTPTANFTILLGIFPGLKIKR